MAFITHIQSIYNIVYTINKLQVRQQDKTSYNKLDLRH